MATAGDEVREVMVTGQLVPIHEINRVTKAVCLLKPSSGGPSMLWSGTGFYVNVKLKKQKKVLDVHAIMTNYHVYLEMKQHDTDMVAVFHYEDAGKSSSEIPLAPLKLFAHSEELDYVLISIDERQMQSIGVKPILADTNKLPTLNENDKVCIIQHPGGMAKHYSHDTIKCVNKPNIEYYADTLAGSSGSPVFVLRESKLLLAALHNIGVASWLSNSNNSYNKGVLLSEILNHLHTGKVNVNPMNLSPGVPDMMESGVDVVDLASELDDEGEAISRIDELIREESRGPKIRVGITGECGAGKSAFINAIRGLNDDDDGAAKVDVTTETTEPAEYQNPDKPTMRFVDLPSIGSPEIPDLSTYCEEVDLEDYDAFLIFTATRFTQNNFELAKKVKSLGKLFFLVRTKIDVDLKAMTGKAAIDEKETLQKIRKSSMEKVKDLISNEEEIFLISNYDKNKWDFSRLKNVVNNVREAIRQEKTRILLEEYMLDVKAHVDKNGVSNIKEFLDEKRQRWKKVHIQFGITGDSGVGKSAFINAIRGLSDEDQGAAKVDVTEATTEPTTYEYPDNPMITLVDLPGIGTPKFPDLHTYCEKVGLEKYDVFLIFTSTRFTKFDLDLAKKVKSMGKSFFLIRTKIDVDVMQKKGKAAIHEDAMLQKIRSDCVANTTDLISSEEDIFLIGNYDKNKWDFDRLVEAIGEALPILQRESFVRSLSNVTRGCLRRKARILKVEAVVFALILTVAAGIPWLAKTTVDNLCMEVAVSWCKNQFGLHNMTDDDIRRIRSNYVVPECKDQVWLLKKTLGVGVSVLSAYFGGGIGVGIQLVSTTYELFCIIDELERMALAVWDDAAKRSIQVVSETSTASKDAE